MITRSPRHQRAPSRPKRFGAGTLPQPTHTKPPAASADEAGLGTSALQKPFSPHTVDATGSTSAAMHGKLTRTTLLVSSLPDDPTAAFRRGAAARASATTATEPSPPPGGPTTRRRPLSARTSAAAGRRSPSRLSQGGGRLTFHGAPVKGAMLDTVEEALLSEARKADAAEAAVAQRRLRADRCLRLRRYDGFASSKLTDVGGYVLKARLDDESTGLSRNATGAGSASATPSVRPRSATEAALSPSRKGVERGASSMGSDSRRDSSIAPSPPHHAVDRAASGSVRFDTSTPTTPAGAVDAAARSVFGRFDDASLEAVSPMSASPSGGVRRAKQLLKQSLSRRKSSVYFNGRRPTAWRRDSEAMLAAGTDPDTFPVALVFPNVGFMLRRRAKHARALVALRKSHSSPKRNVGSHELGVQRRYMHAWIVHAKAYRAVKRFRMRRPWQGLKDWVAFCRLRRNNFIDVVTSAVSAFRLKRLISVWFRYSFVASRVRLAHNERAIPGAVTALQMRLFGGPPRVPEDAAIEQARIAAAVLAASRAFDPVDATPGVPSGKALARMSRGQRHRHYLSDLETATWTEWTDCAVNHAHLREIAAGTRREHWPFLRRVVAAWREVTSMSKRERADDRRLQIWREGSVAVNRKRECWALWRGRMHEAQSAVQYRSKLMQSTLRRWQDRAAKRAWTQAAEVSAKTLIDRRHCRVALRKWQARFDEAKLLETLQVASIVPHAHRLRPYAALLLDRSVDAHWLRLWTALQQWRAFIRRRRTFEAFVVQQQREYTTALKRRALVVWRSRGRVCWASGRSAPGYDHSAYVATKPHGAGAPAHAGGMSMSTRSMHSGGAMGRSVVGSRFGGGDDSASVDLGTTVNFVVPNSGDDSTALRARVRNSALMASDGRDTTNMTSVSGAKSSTSRAMAESGLVHVMSTGTKQPVSLPLPYAGKALPAPDGRLWQLCPSINFHSLRQAESLIRNSDDAMAMPPPAGMVCLVAPSRNDAFAGPMAATSASITGQIKSLHASVKDIRRAATKALFGVERPYFPPVYDSDSDDENDRPQNVFATPFSGFLLRRILQGAFLNAQLHAVHRQTATVLGRKARERECSLITSEVAAVMARLAEADASAVPGPTGNRGSSWGALVAPPRPPAGGGGGRSTGPGPTAMARQGTEGPLAVSYRSDGDAATPPGTTPRHGGAERRVFRHPEASVVDSRISGAASTSLHTHLSLLGAASATGAMAHPTPDAAALMLLTPREAAVKNVRTRKLQLRRGYAAEQRASCIASVLMLCRAELPPHMFSVVGSGTSTQLRPELPLITEHLAAALVEIHVSATRLRMWAAAKGRRVEVAIAAGKQRQVVGLAAEPTGPSTKYTARVPKRKVDRRGRSVFFFDGKGKGKKGAYDLAMEVAIQWRCRALERVLRRRVASRITDVATLAGVQCLRRKAGEKRSQHASTGGGGGSLLQPGAVADAQGRPQAASTVGHSITPPHDLASASLLSPDRGLAFASPKSGRARSTVAFAVPLAGNLDPGSSGASTAAPPPPISP